MYESKGRKYFVVDGHVHFWDASPENQANKYGAGFINCFYDYHKNLSPEEYVWPLEKYQKYTEEDLIHDLFEVGYVDKAIFQPTYLKDFYVKGFNTTEDNGALVRKYPDKLITNGAFDPRHGEEGLGVFEALVREWGLKGVKLYTAEWYGSSKGWKLNEYWSYRYPGAERVRRPGGRDALHPLATEVLRPGRRRAPVLDRRGPHHICVRLRDLAAEVADREVRRFPDPGGHAERAGHDQRRPEGEDPRPEPRAPVRHRGSPRDAGQGHGGDGDRLGSVERGMTTVAEILDALEAVRDP